MNSRPWTREEEIIVFNLYCRIPFQKSSKFHPEVVNIAKLIDRTPSSVNMKIGNFGSFDTNLKVQGIVGLSNASKLDKQIWDEFNNKWDELAYLSESLISKLKGEKLDNGGTLNQTISVPLGLDKISAVKQRINQKFFRECVLCSYGCKCCITGITIPELLIASHIKPWNIATESERTNPRNGICLNSLHDRAFDKGLITVTADFKIKISNKVKMVFSNEILNKYFIGLENTKISLPDKFLPDKLFLEYHNDQIFLN